MSASNTNHTRITQGFQFLLQVLSPYIARELRGVFGSVWWNTGVLGRLYDEQKRNLPRNGDDETLAASLDIYLCLLLLDLHWNETFRKKLPLDCRTWAKELVGVRNRWAHMGNEDFNNDDTWRALDTMSRLCEQLDAKAAEEIRTLLRVARYGSSAGSMYSVSSGQTAQQTAGSNGNAGMLRVSPAGLPCWREVMEPHPDVAQGRYRNAEFAADLAQVARGEGSFEYRDPVEFFARTYVTEGMKGLLVQSVRRVTGKDGEPVIQLKTAFGGGKTHSMLALYHLLRGKAPLEKIPTVRPVLEEAGVGHLPAVHVAVLVGTALDPSRSRRPQNLPGVTINTLWGEMAAQLALSAGSPRLYDIVKEADKKRVSPGSEALKRLFDACGSCLILMDELVAYAKRIYGVNGLPAGSFDNFISFIQEITEAARASKSSLVVASIPESDIEVGGEAGKTALEAIEHTFGRMEAIWKPVAASEGFEVVRRRLFLDCKNPSAREMVCSHFSALYRENPTDFPLEVREVEYRNRLLACYPIHPEVFDRLYEDWATLERFQRTRGVLRLMAAVIHELWMGSDAGLLIMPGSLPLDVSAVRDELTRHLPEGWNSLVDREVDGKRSVPWQQDKNVLRYGKVLASRRVARTIMLGSAPTVRQQNVRGIEASRIRLGVVQPGEQIAVFNDALGSLQNSLAYLYTNPSGDRFWYDTRPTLRKTVEDRATQFSASEVEYEIERRMKKLRLEPPFKGIHICPASSLDVPDDQTVRLVILSPSETVTTSSHGCTALDVAEKIWESRGNSPRIFRNMLVFLAPDQTSMSALEQETRRYLAWQSIKNDSQDLNLDAAQNRETENSLKRSNETVDLRLSETWCWLLTPAIARSDMKTLDWEKIRLSGGSEGIISRAGKKLLENETVIDRWAPALLLMELDSLLWKNADSLQIKKLWEYLCTYCYLPRLSDYSVLEKTIQEGVQGEDYFAYAAGVSEGRFIDLKYAQKASIDRNGFIVRKSAAKNQLELKHMQSNPSPSGFVTDAGVSNPHPSVQREGGTPLTTERTGTEPSTSPSSLSTPKSMRFFLSAPLDDTRVNRDVQRILEEVISQLAADNGVTLSLRLEVEAGASKGFSQETIRAVSENCRTLKIKEFGFEEEE